MERTIKYILHVFNKEFWNFSRQIAFLVLRKGMRLESKPQKTSNSKAEVMDYLVLGYLSSGARANQF